jgi:hypothetical protein
LNFKVPFSSTSEFRTFFALLVGGVFMFDHFDSGSNIGFQLLAAESITHDGSQDFPRACVLLCKE